MEAFSRRTLNLLEICYVITNTFAIYKPDLALVSLPCQELHPILRKGNEAHTFVVSVCAQRKQNVSKRTIAIPGKFTFENINDRNYYKLR